ncbi:phage baseplate assembly protein V [Selenomonas bovis]|uniref:phage baseplate assembly protein V n=1 Tax=Selenomonas bovis TaxID=416586 RepID=UPI0004E27938|nr:phage baseplate assembly protein V [Selenomonas bovis]MDY6268652.1 contractile injection system protein, VgrG/Pvc8 family [Selenomonadaceae bacterium]
MEISGWKIPHLVSFRLEKRADAHSRLRFCVSVRTEDADAYFQQAGKTVCVLDAEKKGVFFGKVEAVERAARVGDCQLTVEATSATLAADTAVQQRVFQDPEKTLGDVLSAKALASLGEVEVSIECASEIRGRKLPHLLLQQETDFAFACRLAAAAGAHVWCVDTNEQQSKLFVGAARDWQEQTIKERDCIRLRVAQGTTPHASVTLGAYTYELGQRVELLGCHYVIDRVLVERVHGSDRVTYDMTGVTEAKDGDIAVPALHAARLTGIVMSAKDELHQGRVLVNFTDGKEGVKDVTPGKLWIPYRPPYAGQQGGIVFLPEPGDRVEAIVADRNAYVTTELRRKKPLPQECQDPLVKYIGNNTKQRVFWRPKSLELWSTDTNIVLDDKNIDMTVGKPEGARIHIDAKNIVMTVGKNRLRLTEQGMALERGTSEIVLDDKGTYLRRDGQQIALDQNVQIKSGGTIDAAAGGAANIHADGTLKLDASGTASLNGSHVELA